MLLLLLAGDGLDGAGLLAEQAARAVVVDAVGDQLLAHPGGALLVADVRLGLIPVVAQRREDRVRGGASQAAQ